MYVVTYMLFDCVAAIYKFLPVFQSFDMNEQHYD